MTKSDAERCYLAYNKNLIKSTIPFALPLTFIVTSLADTEYTYGVSGPMRENLHKPLELFEIIHERNIINPYSFVLKIYIVRQDTHTNDYVTCFYDYKDIIIEENTKGMIDFILSEGKSENTIAPKIQTFKFDEKNLYNFKKERKI